MAKNTQTGPEDLEEPQSGNSAFSLLSILRTIWKRKVRIALTWILVASIGVVVVRMLPPVYDSEALILVDNQQIPEKFVSATVASDLDQRIAAIRQTLLSSGELKKIIDDFGLYREQRKTHFDEEILDMMRKDITITMEPVGGGSDKKRTAAFRMGYQGSDPATVMKVANRLADLCVDENSKTRRAQASGTSQFIDSQLVEAKKQLDQLEAAVSKYKLQHNGELPEQEQALASTLSRLQTELEANRDAINRAQQTRVIMEGNLNAMEVTLSAQVRAWQQALSTSDGDAPVSLSGKPAPPQKKQSEVMQEQLTVLRGRYSDDYPDVIRLRADIEKVKRVEEQRAAANAAAIANPAAPTSGTGPSLAPATEPVEFVRTRQQIALLKAQIKAADKELDDGKVQQQRILKNIDTYQHHISQLPVREQEMSQITRDYEISKANYKSLLDKKMAANMALDMENQQESERFEVLDRAQLPQKPVKPKRPMLYGAALGAGLALGLVFGFSAELRGNVVLGEWELPEGTTVLARLPFISVKGTPGKAQSTSRGPRFTRRKVLAFACVTTLFLAGGAIACLKFLLHWL